MRAATVVEARCLGGGSKVLGWGLSGPGHSASYSGQRGLGQPREIIGLGGGRRETIVFRPKTGDLELQSLHPGTQSGDLVEQAPIGRRTYVAEQGLRHHELLVRLAVS